MKRYLAIAFAISLLSPFAWAENGNTKYECVLFATGHGTQPARGDFVYNPHQHVIIPMSTRGKMHRRVIVKDNRLNWKESHRFTHGGELNERYQLDQKTLVFKLKQHYKGPTSRGEEETTYAAVGKCHMVDKFAAKQAGNSQGK